MDGGWMGVAAGVAASGVFLAHAARGRSSSFFGNSVYRGDPKRRAIALTFDDGPSESTPVLLDMLDRHKVPATFFMCGHNVRRCPDVAREVRARGHSIGNHTYSHPLLGLKSPGFILREMTLAQDRITETTGITPRWFRAPYGVRWFGVGEAQKRLGLTGVMWTVIARDYALSAPEITNRLLRHASSGGIFCLHDGRGVRTAPNIQPTLDAVEAVIPQLRDRGFEFLSLNEMVCPAI
jgi:peptidoglycan-N-acetylglucosamine deacetylase